MKRKKSYAELYILLTLICFAVSVIYVFITQGELLNRYLFRDRYDTGMDFFNSVIYTKGRHPYIQYNTIYPPLANLFFWILSHFVPVNEKLNWPDTFRGSIEIRATSIDLRVRQATLILFIGYLIFLVVVLLLVISLYSKNTYFGFCFGLAFLMSYGFLYSLERGNIIALSLVFLLFFLRYYRSKNKILREIAFISLAISAGIKLYPALFGILLIYEKNWKEIIRTIVYGIIAFVLPFVIFDGFKGFQSFYRALTAFSVKDSDSASIARYHLPGILKSICVQLGELFHFDVTPVISMDFKICTVVVLFIFLLGLLVEKKSWKRILIIGFLVLFLQDSGAYTLIFLFPAILFFCMSEKVSKRSFPFFLLLTLLHLPLPIMGRIEIYSLNFITMFEQDVMAVLIVLMIIDILVASFNIFSKKI